MSFISKLINMQFISVTRVLIPVPKMWINGCDCFRYCPLDITCANFLNNFLKLFKKVNKVIYH